MTTELEDRIRAGVRELADALVVTPPPLGAVVERMRDHRGRRRTLPVLVAAAVAAVLVMVPLLLPFPGQRVDPAAGSARLPRQFAPFSFLTGDLAASPLDRAMAVYAQRYGGGVLGRARVDGNDPDWQLVVLDASGDRYRRTHAIDPVSYRIGIFPGGSRFPSMLLLAPDGRHVAFGSAAISLPELRVLDVPTGSVRRYAPVPNFQFAPLAWSPDGTRLVVALGSSDVRSEVRAYGVLDLATGAFTRYDGVRPDWAAFSPDGSELALQTGGHIVVVDDQGRSRRQFALPANTYLAGQAAWSPDGAVVAVIQADDSASVSNRVLTFIDPVDGSVTSDRIPIDSETTVQGWRSSGSVVTWDAVRLTQVSIHSGQRSTLAETGANVSYLQIAYGLVSSAFVVDPGESDRGPWPGWARLTLSVIVGFVAVVAIGITRILLRRRRSRR